MFKHTIEQRREVRKGAVNEFRELEMGQGGESRFLFSQICRRLFVCLFVCKYSHNFPVLKLVLGNTEEQVLGSIFFLCA